METPQTVSTTISGTISRPDQTTLSSGTAMLYKKTNFGFNPIETVAVQSNGTYLFTEVRFGAYIIKVTPPSTENAFPTYYESSTNWFDATVTFVTDNEPVENKDITIILKSTEQGTASISGKVTEVNRAKNTVRSAPDIDVYLQKSVQPDEWTTVTATLTDENGRYQLSALPAGKYRVILDIPGLEMLNYVEKTLAEGETLNGIDFEITDEGILTIDNTVGISTPAGISGLRVYPNPTTGQLKIKNYELQITNERTLSEVEVFDVAGRNVFSAKARKHEGTNENANGRPSDNRISEIGQSEIVLDISHLPAGVYFLKVGKEMVKVVKK